MANITPRCWNCGSVEKWTDIASMEKCDACGIACYYHGSGGNQAYYEAMDRKDAREEAEWEAAERRREAREEYERELWENENIRNDLYY